MKRVNKSRQDKKHFAFIRELNCLRCGSFLDIVVAHIRKFTDGAMGLKPSPKYTVPLCDACHKFQHNKGEVTFWGGEENVRKAIDYANCLYDVSGDLRVGTALVNKARREIWA